MIRCITWLPPAWRLGPWHIWRDFLGHCCFPGLIAGAFIYFHFLYFNHFPSSLWTNNITYKCLFLGRENSWRMGFTVLRGIEHHFMRYFSKIGLAWRLYLDVLHVTYVSLNDILADMFLFPRSRWQYQNTVNITTIVCYLNLKHIFTLKHIPTFGLTVPC